MEFQIQPKPITYFKIMESPFESFSPHLHSFYELVLCEKGQACVSVAGKDYTLSPGDAVLIFPYQVHSYPAQSGGVWYLSTFAPEMIGTFAGQYGNYLPREHLFRFSYDVSRLSVDSSIFAKKAFLYSMCAAADAQMDFILSASEGRRLLEKMFILVEKNFTEPDFSLRQLSRMLDYDYGYLSKIFIERTGMRFSYYLNLRRITCAGDLLRRGMCVNIEDAAYSCGYNNVRSFNRNFKSIHGTTPLEYLQKTTGQS